jgi:hypothetical protein
VLTVLSAPDLHAVDEYEDNEASSDEVPDWRSALRGYKLDGTAAETVVCVV